MDKTNSTMSYNYPIKLACHLEGTKCYDMETMFFRQSVPININNTHSNKIFVILFNAGEFFLILLLNVSSVGFYP